jgi:hypothetical protein
MAITYLRFGPIKCRGRCQFRPWPEGKIPECNKYYMHPSEMVKDGWTQNGTNGTFIFCPECSKLKEKR